MPSFDSTSVLQHISAAGGDPSTAYRPPSRNDLVGTTWRVISITGEQPYPDYHSLVYTFQTNSKLTTLVIDKDGNGTTVPETYQLVDDILVISGVENGQKYAVDGKLDVQNKSDDICDASLPDYCGEGELYIATEVQGAHSGEARARSRRSSLVAL